MKQKVYYKNLNGFRFIAAFMVIICHLELYKSRIDQPNYWKFPLIFEAGSAGVDFFFVLSGFLITSLLLLELESHGRIDLKKFYIRRVLRIWPLYYLVVLLCFLIVPYLSIFHIDRYSEQLNIHYWPKFLYSIFFMPNVALFFYGEIPYSAPLWSVGVEEQFYLFWPLIILYFIPQLRAIFTVIIFFISLKILLFFLGKFEYLDIQQYELVKNFIVGTRVECMGIGGLGAYLMHGRYKIGQYLVRNQVAIASAVLIPFVLYFANYLFELHHLILSVLFLVIILNGAFNSRTFINLERRAVFTLGTISFGLYLWHPLCIGIVLWLMNTFDVWEHTVFVSNAVYYLLSIGFTILLSYMSYFYFEQSFIRMKARYTRIISGNEARLSEKLIA